MKLRDIPLAPALIDQGERCQDCCFHNNRRFLLIKYMTVVYASHMPRWGKPYKDKRNWKEYKEEPVIRGKMLFDLDFADQ